MQMDKIMQDTPEVTPPNRWLRRLPFLIILAGFAVALIQFRDLLSFDALARNRESLLALRDAHYIWASLAFIAVYTTVVDTPRASAMPGFSIVARASTPNFVNRKIVHTSAISATATPNSTMR